MLFKLPTISPAEDQPTILRIVESAVFLLVGMTQNPRQGYYNCERRKVAIRSLLGSINVELINGLPFPRAYGKFLQNYFNQPSEEIKLVKDTEPSRDVQEVLRQARDQRNSNKKTYMDKAFDNLSSTMLDIVTEGE